VRRLGGTAVVESSSKADDEGAEKQHRNAAHRGQEHRLSPVPRLAPEPQDLAVGSGDVGRLEPHHVGEVGDYEAETGQGGQALTAPSDRR